MEKDKSQADGHPKNRNEKTRTVTTNKRGAADMSDGKARKKNPAAVALGRLGGLRGGRARAEKLSPAQRSKSARKAALARWKNYDKKKNQKRADV